MKKPMIKILGIVLLSLFITQNDALSTQIYFEPNDQLFNVGDTLTYDLMADIDELEAIMGFGFDLSFDGGNTYATGPGDSGSALIFDSFTPNADLGFIYDPLYDSDEDTISGFLRPFDPDVSGNGLILGTFQFTAFSPVLETIYISADDIESESSTEGLVPGFTANNWISFLPNAATATAAPVPEPGTIILMLMGLGGLGIVKRKLA